MVNRRAGFSLVELAITLAILALLLLVGASLTTTWVQRAKVGEAKSKLLQAYGSAVAVAQRNAVGIALPGVAAAVKVVGQNLMVCSGKATDCTAQVSTWKAELPSNTSVSIGGAQALEFDNTGAASISPTYAITSGNQSESGTLR